jgi:hypothetical protein
MTANIVLGAAESEILSGTLSPHLFSIVPEVWAKRQEKNWRFLNKKEVKLSLSTDKMTLCVENPKDSSKKKKKTVTTNEWIHQNYRIQNQH